MTTASYLTDWVYHCFNDRKDKSTPACVTTDISTDKISPGLPSE